MKIELDRKYKTRMGDVVTILKWEQRNFLFPYIGENSCGIITTYNETGHVHLVGKSPNDLVEKIEVETDEVNELNLLNDI